MVGTVANVTSSTVPFGYVISENPAAGTQVNVGSAVNLVVSSGPAQVAVPNVVGQTQAAATTAITSASLVVGTLTTASSSTVPAGSVISENPAAGTPVNVGSAVSLVVSAGASFLTGFALNNPTQRNDYSGFVGMQFSVGANPLMLTSLGRLCLAGNTQIHTVKLLSVSTGADVAGGSVSINMAGCTPGQFVYVGISLASPLAAGGNYYLVSQEIAGGDKWYNYGTITTANVASATGIVYSVGSNYVGSPVANNSYVPVNFQYSAGSTLPPQYALSTNISPAGGGTLTASPTGPSYLSGTPVQLTATAAPGCTFANFSGALSGTANPQSVTMTGPLSVTANFTCSTQPPGSALLLSFASTSLRNDFGGFVGMKFTVGTNPMAVNALGRACAPGNSQTHTVKLVNASTGVDVPNGSAQVSMAGCTPGIFNYANVTLTLPAGGNYYVVSQETVGGDQWYNYGAVTPTSAAAVNGPVYLSNGNYVMVNAPNASYVPVNLQYGATTTPTQYLLTTSVAPPGGGSITASPSAANGYYNDGTSVQLTAVPAGGCTFANWSGALSGSTNPQSVTMNAAQSVTANFTCSTPPVTNFVTSFTSMSLRNDYGDFVGMQFTVRGGHALNIASLGRICAPGNTGTHLLKLVNAATGVDVAGGSVMVNMAGCTSGQFTYVALANPVNLLQGNYYLVSHEVAGGDKWYDHGLVVPTTDATVNGSVYFYSGSWFPQASPNTSYVPVSFQYSL